MSSAEQGLAPALVSSAPMTSSPTEPPVSRNERLAGLLVVVSMTILPLMISSLFTMIVGERNESDTSIRYRYVFGITMQLSSLGLLAYVVRQNRQKWSDLGLVFRYRDIAYGILIWIAALICYRLASPSVLSLCQSLGWHPTPANVPSARLGSFLGFVYVVMSPIFEEMIVRAFVMTETLALTGSVAIAVLVSVLLQTSYHFYQGVPYALSASVIFLVFSLYYARTRRILPVIAAHFIWDLFFFLTSVLHHAPVKT